MNEDNIVQLSMPRTGSTLLFQVLRDIFPEKVISKAHEWNPLYKENPIVGSYRDPRATAVSYWRTNRNINDPKRKMSRSDILKYSKLINNQSKYFEPFIKNTINHERIIYLKYELFFNNFDYLFGEIEGFFNIKINELSKLKIKEERSVDSNNKISMNFNSFKRYDVKTLIHGNHIYKNGDNESWRDFLKEGDVSVFEESVVPAMKTLGYI